MSDRGGSRHLIDQLPDDYVPPPKGTWMQPEDMEPFDEEAEGEDRLDKGLLTSGEIKTLRDALVGEGEPLPEDQDSTHFGDDPQIPEGHEPDAIVSIPVNPLQFIQESIVRGLLDSLEPFQKTRGACFQMALTLKPNADVDDLLSIAQWLFLGGGQYNDNVRD